MKGYNGSPERVVKSTGSVEYVMNGTRHRDDGPAYEVHDGTKIWYQYGYIHRLDGPAIEWPNGALSWFIMGEKFTFQDFIRRIERGNLLTEEDVKEVQSSYFLDSI